MKASDPFKTVISEHLQSVAATDQLFAITLKKKNKTIDECINYILKTVKDSGSCGFPDDEIFQMAVHYYDEDDITAKDAIKARVVINRAVDSAPSSKPAVNTPVKKVTKKSPSILVEQTSLF